MGTWISPYHYIPDGTDIGRPNEWDIEYQIEIFFARTDGWHLKVADKCINGWINDDGSYAINTHHHEGLVHYIPDSAWAVLQMALNYFETIAYFKLFDGHQGQIGAGKLFKKGVNSVFSDIPEESKTAVILWKDLRNGLYHKGINKSHVRLQHTDDTKPIHPYDDSRDVVVVDPHKLIPVLRKDLLDYVTSLQNPVNTNIREGFKKAFNRRYTS